MNNKNAYSVGVKMALHDIGSEKIAGIGSILGPTLGGAGLGAGVGYLAGGDAQSALQGGLIGGLGGLGMRTGGSLAVHSTPSAVMGQATRGVPSAMKKVIGRARAGGMGGLAAGLGVGGMAANLSRRGLSDSPGGRRPGPTEAQQEMYGLSPEQSMMLARQQRWDQ